MQSERAKRWPSVRAQVACLPIRSASSCNCTSSEALIEAVAGTPQPIASEAVVAAVHPRFRRCQLFPAQAHEHPSDGKQMQYSSQKVNSQRVSTIGVFEAHGVRAYLRAVSIILVITCFDLCGARELVLRSLAVQLLARERPGRCPLHVSSGTKATAANQLGYHQLGDPPREMGRPRGPRREELAPTTGLDTIPPGLKTWMRKDTKRYGMSSLQLLVALAQQTKHRSPARWLSPSLNLSRPS